MKIESRVPQAMDNPMPPAFGRMDALRGSSVEITEMIDSTKRHENRCVGGPGHGRTEYTHVWSLRRTGIDFRSILCRFCVCFLLSYNLYTTRTPGRTAASPLQTDICHPANQRIARSLPTRTIFLSFCQSVVLPVCQFAGLSAKVFAIISS